jgi:Secretion system C-terminal sorting domain
VYMAGVTGSGSGIADGGHQNTIGGDSDAFLAKINSSGVRQWATYFGGTASEWGFGCSTGSANNVYLAGYTESTSGIADGGHQNTKSVGEDGFLAKFRSIAIGLPVQLTRFEGQCIGTGVELLWQTATEINNKKFVVERSENQQLWSVAGEVAGAGNSTQPRQYQFRDEKAGVGPLRFYRLKQVDFDGKTTLSPVVKIQCNTSIVNALRVYPNPTNQGKVFVKGWTEAGRYFLVNAMGQAVKNGQLQGDLPAIELSGLAPGIYFLNIEGKIRNHKEKIIIR